MEGKASLCSGRNGTQLNKNGGRKESQLSSVYMEGGEILSSGSAQLSIHGG